jgi:hypothetical protein
VRWLLKAQFLDEDRFALWHTERSDYRARNESEEIADLEGRSDQSDCQHHRPDVIAVRNSDTCGADSRQTNRRKKDQDIEAQAKRCANQESNAESRKRHGIHPNMLMTRLTVPPSLSHRRD